VLRSASLVKVWGVEQFLGQDALVSLDFAVVAWGEGPGPLVAGDVEERPGERGRAVAGSVVGDHAGEPGDAVGGEERPGAGEEGDRGGRFLIR
jgi:hypothetical protein